MTALKILLKAPFSPYSGYGNDGIGLTRALVKAGYDVYLQPTHVDAPLPQDVADLLTKRLEAPFDLGIVHVDPGALELTDGMRSSCTVVVGWTMWEFSSLDNLKSRSSLRKRLKTFDALLAYDEVTARCFKDYFKGPIMTLQGGFEPEQWPEVEREWGTDDAHSQSRFGFFMCGQLHDRKNPFAAIRAFKELKEEYPEEFDLAELHLKTNIPSFHPAMEEWIPKLRIHYETWPTEILREFYAAQHVMLAPSRGEGKNMPALEFQSTGGVVIATNWGGMTTWLSNEYAYPLSFTLQPIDNNPKNRNCMNADADIDHLKSLMLHVFRNRAEAARKGSLAAENISRMCSWDSVADRLFLQIKNAIPVEGSKLYNQSRMVKGERSD